MATPDTLTVICAYDNAEAQTVRRDLGLPDDQVMEATDAARLEGIHVWDLCIVETPRFLQRPDAGEIRKVLHVVSQGARHTSRDQHPGEGRPAPYLRGGDRSRAARAGAADDAEPEGGQEMPTRDQIRALLDSGRTSEEISDIIISGMHLGFGDHPVVREILARRTAAYEAHIQDGVGETAEQIYSADKVRDLVEHIERLTAQYADQELAARLPAIRASIAPGAHVVTVYGVRIRVEPDAPVIAEQHGNPDGHRTYREVVERAVPAGTRPDRTARMLVPSVTDDKPMYRRIHENARLSLGRELGEPHIILHLTRGDLPEGQWPLEHVGAHDGVLIIGVTVRAIPGQIKQMVLRPGPGLPPGWLGKDEGAWRERPPYSNELMVPRMRGLLPEAGVLSSQLPVAEFGRARPTGRIEVNGEGGIAEVWEVTL
ncbi:hypothetical protein AB0G05_26735 [Nonomuraea wenchangensis]